MMEIAGRGKVLLNIKSGMRLFLCYPKWLVSVKDGVGVQPWMDCKPYQAVDPIDPNKWFG